MEKDFRGVLMQEILKWIEDLNKNTQVIIQQNKLSDSNFWFYDEASGHVRNSNNAFFSIVGIKGNVNDKYIEQPILIQDEVGYLGILCKEFDGVTHYLMQAKIEPGNINCVQVSPTIQATKSNFTQKHGGAKPKYLDFFINASKHQIICDQLQSEQSSRFYKKRNRNMIIKVEEDVVVEDRFKWMTLTEIKELMRHKNLVNMDTRTVLSCLPLMDPNIEKFDNTFSRLEGKYKELYNSIHNPHYVEEVTTIYHEINNYKMFNDSDTQLVRLDELENWIISDDEITCKQEYPYKVIFCDLEIEGREVKKWTQPLFKANGLATFGLMVTHMDGMVKFLVKLTPEIGCFDSLEIGPTILKEYGEAFDEDSIESLFQSKLDHQSDIRFDTILSEEGGRFYHEENRNIIMYVDNTEIEELPEGYFWVSYAALNHLNLVNNCLNIQLRNLLSVLEV